MTTSTDQPKLHRIAHELTGDGRGILAADESIKTMSSRLEAEGITASDTARRDYRELLLTAPGLSGWASGIILCDETFNQNLSDGRAFPHAANQLGVLPGIKVDTGTTPLPGGDGALITEGLDGLGPRLAKYAEQGAAFAKWRAVYSMQTTTPYTARANASALARYAALCQEHSIVPIVEPEVLSGGTHDLETCRKTSSLVLAALFEELALAGVDLAGTVLKPNFVTPGLDASPEDAERVAQATVDTLREHVPPEVGGIAFLSGGHPTADACAFLSGVCAIQERPWPATFSFGRALVSDALRVWAGDTSVTGPAQEALLSNCTEAASASRWKQREVPSS